VKSIVIIIDDDVDLLHMIERRLGKAGVETRCFSLAASAIAFFELHLSQVGAVCVDLSLPDMSGFEVCAWLRAQSATKRLPILVMTGRTGLDEEARALEAGADVFLSKPFRAGRLLAELGPLLGAERAIAPEVSG
jgi:DNA-binding response OmpR family regulator